MITFLPRCVMSGMTLGILKISSGILCQGAPLLLVSTKRGAAKKGGGAIMHFRPGRAKKEILNIKLKLKKYLLGE